MRVSRTQRWAARTPPLHARASLEGARLSRTHSGSANAGTSVVARSLPLDNEHGNRIPTPQEIEAKFWKALKSDMTMMLGLDGVEDGHARPMTAQLDADRGPMPATTVAR